MRHIISQRRRIFHRQWKIGVVFYGSDGKKEAQHGQGHKDTFAQFANNPEKFIAEVSRTIRSALAEMVIEHVSYAALGEDRRYEANVFLGNQIARSDMKILRDDRQVLQKHIYDYLF